MQTKQKKIKINIKTFTFIFIFSKTKQHLELFRSEILKKGTCIIHDDMLFTHELCNCLMQDAFSYQCIGCIQYHLNVIKVVPSVHFSCDFFCRNCLQQIISTICLGQLIHIPTISIFDHSCIFQYFIRQFLG